MATAGLLGNVARVSGVDDNAAFAYLDDDPAYVFGAAPGVHIEKAINAINPLAPTGPRGRRRPRQGVRARHPGRVDVPRHEHREHRGARSPASSTTTARRTSSDDDFTPRYVSGDTDGDGFLDLGEVWLYTSVGAVVHNSVLGRYYNLGTVTALEPRTAQTVGDDDAATYMGVGRGRRPDAGLLEEQRREPGGVGVAAHPGRHARL